MLRSGPRLSREPEQTGLHGFANPRGNSWEMQPCQVRHCSGEAAAGERDTACGSTTSTWSCAILGTWHLCKPAQMLRLSPWPSIQSELAAPGCAKGFPRLMATTNPLPTDQKYFSL